METIVISITGDPENWEYKTLEYKNRNKTLKIEIEASYAGGSNWIIPVDSIQSWDGENQKLSQIEKEDIMRNIKAWGISNQIEFVFSIGEKRAEVEQYYKSMGWTVIKNQDGSFTCAPPK